MGEVSIARGKELRKLVTSSVNCLVCNVTGGIVMRARNSKLLLNFSQFNDRQYSKVILDVRKVSGNGSIFFKTLNFTKKEIVSGNYRIELPFSETVEIFRDSTSIGEVSIVGINVYTHSTNNTEDMNKRAPRRVQRNLYSSSTEYKTSINAITKKPEGNYVIFIVTNWSISDYKQAINLLEIYDINGVIVDDFVSTDSNMMYYNALAICSNNIRANEYIVNNNLSTKLIDMTQFADISYQFVVDYILKNVKMNADVKEIQADQSAKLKIEQKDNTDTSNNKKTTDIVVEGNLRFKVIIPAYNTERWILKTLESIEAQEYRNFDVCIVDDSVGNEKQRTIIRDFCESHNSKENSWKYIFNIERRLAMHNIVSGIENIGCKDNDVIVNIDGDDWLYGKSVFNRVKAEYDKGVFMTYGQYISYPSMTIGHCAPYSEQTIINRNFRRDTWLMSHLRTYKYFLFKNINKNDFKKSGNYLEMAADLALMYPMAEMAGNKISFISDILYVYNRENELNDDKVDLNKQISSAGYIKGLRKYNIING